MDWDKLRIFHTVAHSGSFTEAGNRMNLSQSSVSRQISTLEHELDIKLFHRHARGLLLTEQGEILQKTAEEVFQKLHIVEGRLKDSTTLPEGSLVITVSDFVGSTWLAPRLREFRERYPSIQLTVLFDDRVLNIGMREADAAIRLHKPKDTSLVQRRIGTIHFHICASQGYLEEHGTPQTLEDLKSHTLIGFPEGAQAPIQKPHWLFEQVGADMETDSNLIMMNSIYAIYNTLKSGAGIAVLPEYLIANDKNDLTTILLDHEPPSVNMYFTYAQERKDSQRILLFRNFLIDSINQTQL